MGKTTALKNAAAEIEVATQRGELRWTNGGIAPVDAMAWVFWKRLRTPGFMPDFPFTFDDLARINPQRAAAIDQAFGQGPAAR